MGRLDPGLDEGYSDAAELPRFNQRRPCNSTEKLPCRLLYFGTSVSVRIHLDAYSTAGRFPR